LYLLHPDGSSEEVVMGPDLTAGQQVQFTVPAGVWQGGCLAEGGEYALFGCTMAPGFTPGCFEAGLGGPPDRTLPGPGRHHPQTQRQRTGNPHAGCAVALRTY
jgi:hypothetical protein